MTTIEHACILNDQGVSLLISGECEKSIVLFQRALSIMKEAAYLLDDIQPLAHGESTLQRQRPLYPLRTSNLAVADLHQELSFIYNQPFLLDGDYMTEDIDSTLPLYSAVLLFNLALACHQKGRLGRESSLSRASHLYRMCLQLLENMPERTAAVAILAIAALNNKAQVQFELCNYNHSRQCLIALSKLLCDARPMLAEAVNSSVLEGLILNSLMLDPPSAAHAA